LRQTAPLGNTLPVNSSIVIARVACLAINHTTKAVIGWTLSAGNEPIGKSRSVLGQKAEKHGKQERQK
jgi:hypothetical protein